MYIFHEYSITGASERKPEREGISVYLQDHVDIEHASSGYLHP